MMANIYAGYSYNLLLTIYNLQYDGQNIYAGYSYKLILTIYNLQCDGQ